MKDVNFKEVYCRMQEAIEHRVPHDMLGIIATNLILQASLKTSVGESVDPLQVIEEVLAASGL